MPDDLKPTDDNTETGVSVEDIMKAGDYPTYEKLRQNAESGTTTAVPPVNRDDTDAPPDETGEESAEDSDDGSADAGSQKAAKKAKDSLPAGVKRRLEREKRKAAAAEKEAAEWKRKFEEAQGKPETAEPHTEEEPEKEVGEPKAKASTEPLSPEEYDEKYEYPDETDYGTDTNDGLKAFLEDVDRWEKNEPLQGGKWAEGYEGDTDGQADKPLDGGAPAQPEPGPIDDGESDHDQIIQQQFEDVREALEEADGSDDDLAGDFFDQLQADKFKLSAEMLEWLADHDDAAKVAAMFVKAPRKANRIFRAPKSKHAQLLAELAAGDADEKPPTRATDNRDGKPVVDDFNGRRPRDPSKRLAGAKDFNSYASLRDDMGGPTGRSRSAA